VDMGRGLQVDGVIGPKTASAAVAMAQHCALLADAYGAARRNYYFRLADLRPASRKFVRNKQGGKGGWIHRAEAFMQPRFHLSQAQFNARVAAWH
ncbi:MAG: putative peptidoglycan-binding domain-containing protein, partial [Lutimaribacter sp.]